MWVSGMIFLICAQAPASSPILAPPAGCRARSRAPMVTDSVLAAVGTHDGATELVLTNTRIVFRFTEAGVRWMERDINRSIKEQGLGAWTADFVREGALRGIRGMEITFDVEGVREVRYADGALTLYTVGRSVDADEPDTRGKFVVEPVAGRDAERFIEEFIKLRARAEWSSRTSHETVRRTRAARDWRALTY